MKRQLHARATRSGFRPLGLWAALLALLSGCTTAPKTEGPKPTFFPPAPDEPHVQFLTSFSSDVELGRRGTFSEFVTGATAPTNGMVKPYGIAVHGGKIFVCDTKSAVIAVFDLAKKTARYFAPPNEGHLETPINLAIDADGTRYVADVDRNQVLIYGKNETYLGAIGTKGEMRPCDVGLTADRLYVADVAGHAVRVYGKSDRKLLFTIPRDAKGDDEKLFSPTNLAIDKERGHLLVSDTGGCALQIYDLEGKHVRKIGEQGVGPGMFARPKGVAVDRGGVAYVVDATTQAVQMFDADGKALMSFGHPGTTAYGELVLPAGVDVDYETVGHFQKYVAPGYHCEYLILVTSQFGSRLVNVYGFVKKK